ncbi:DUF881 domain-containing protein [Brassicibacter mesophilus]|uniref:DUF881 domain-containing protein n=1 Tax=Brassicibacter mesophilus TaxID=745119 RepID=UPI003D2162B3
MKGLKEKITMFIACILLGIILSIQFNTTQNVTDGINPTVRIKTLALNLEALSMQKEQLRNELDNIESTIRIIEEDFSKNNNFFNKLYNELQMYSIFLGNTDVSGSGIIIRIDELQEDITFGDGTNTIAENYDLFLHVISSLNAANAEAISINDIRYTSYSTIYVKNNALEIDEYMINPPVIIKVIGDPKELEYILTLRDGGLDVLKNMPSIKVDINKESDIQIPRTSKEIDFKYVKPYVNPIEDTNL